MPPCNFYYQNPNLLQRCCICRVFEWKQQWHTKWSWSRTLVGSVGLMHSKNDIYFIHMSGRLQYWSCRLYYHLEFENIKVGWKRNQVVQAKCRYYSFTIAGVLLWWAFFFVSLWSYFQWNEYFSLSWVTNVIYLFISDYNHTTSRWM